MIVIKLYVIAAGKSWQETINVRYLLVKEKNKKAYNLYKDARKIYNEYLDLCEHFRGNY